MKKIIAIASTITVLLGSSAYAKTEGSYLGLDVHRAVVQNKFTDTPNQPYQQSKSGFGVNYKYAFNFDKIFVAPGLFYERIGTKNVDFANADNVGGDIGIFSNSLSLKNRYGVKLDLGYDINDKFAAYVTGGFANLRYRLSTISGINITDYTRGETGFLFGAGVLSHISDNFTLGLEYNTQSFRVKQLDNNTHTKTSIDLYKLTAAYHF